MKISVTATAGGCLMASRRGPPLQNEPQSVPPGDSKPTPGGRLLPVETGGPLPLLPGKALAARHQWRRLRDQRDSLLYVSMVRHLAAGC